MHSGVRKKKGKIRVGGRKRNACYSNSIMCTLKDLALRSELNRSEMEYGKDRETETRRRTKRKPKNSEKFENDRSKTGAIRYERIKKLQTCLLSGTTDWGGRNGLWAHQSQTIFKNREKRTFSGNFSVQEIRQSAGTPSPLWVKKV